MTPTEHSPKTPSPRTGIFALLSSPLRVVGTGAPKKGQGTGALSERTRRAIKNNKSHFLIVFVGVLLVSALMATTALAAPGHVFSSSFGTKGTSPGQLEDPTGLAVNNVTGDVYVVDKVNNRVEEFNPAGTKLEAEFNGSGTLGELSEPEAIAIDNSGRTSTEDPSVGDVYVTDHNVVDKFEADGTYVGQMAEAEGTAFAPLAGVAVDPKGVVWVYQGLGGGGGHIDAFSDARANAFLSGRESKASFEACLGLAVDSEDDLYVGHACGEIHPWIAKLNSSGEVFAPKSFWNHVSGNEEQKTGVTVDSSNNDVYLDSVPTESGEPAQIEEFAPGATAPTEVFGAAQLTDGGGTALVVSYAPVSSGDVYVIDSTAGKIDMFVPPKATAYAESFHFGGKGAGSGEFAEPLGVAVNDSTNPLANPQAEDVYVVDKGNKRVEQFSTGGAFIAKFAPPGGFNEPEAIAVDNCKNVMGEPCSTEEDPSVGDVYVTDQLPPSTDLLPGGEHYRHANATVYKFDADGTYLGQLRRCPEDEIANGETCVAVGQPTPGFDESLTGVAVGPEGNVWVGTPYDAEGLLRFSAEGIFETYLKTTSFQVTGLALGADENGEEVGYVAERNGNGEVEDFKFDFSSGMVLSEGFSRPGTSALGLDLATGDLFVDKESSIERYAPVEAPKPSPLESFPSTPLQASQGIAVSPVGTVYATERTAGDVKGFAEFPLAQVLVGAVADLRPTSVTLQGSVNPEGAKVGTCEFEYGTTTSYGQIAECEPAAGSLGEGTEPKLVGAKLSGLPSGTTYHYRLLASDAHGTSSGVDNTFTTPGPSIAEEQVTYVEATAATLQALIDPNGGATSYHFEYDTTPYTSGAAHGTSVPIPDAAIGSGTSAVPVSVRVTGLHPGTVLYYRAVAAGEPLGAPEAFYGLDRTFTTNSGSEPTGNCPNEKPRAEQPYGLTLPDCRAYEIVSPLDTGGQDAVHANSAQGLRASFSGEAIAYESAGSFAEPEGAALNSEFLSRRARGGWSTQAISLLQEPLPLTASSYRASVFTPELEAGVADSTASLTSAAPKNRNGEGAAVNKLYVTDFGERSSEQSYRYVGEVGFETVLLSPMGASTDLSHVVFGEGDGNAYEWVNGAVLPVGVANNGEMVPVGVGGVAADYRAHQQVDAWHAVSADGSRVYFTSPGTEVNPENQNLREPPGQLYVRVNADQPKSAVRHPEANVTGTLSSGSNVVTSIAPVSATERPADLKVGSPEVKLYEITPGEHGLYPFAVGQPISGPGIPEGDTIAALSAESLTLSAPAEASGTKVLVTSTRADSFVVGEHVSGYGLALGTTVTGVGSGTLTLSSASDVSASDVAVSGGGECTEPTRACTAEVSASRRSTSDTHGLQAARFWGASTGKEGAEGGPSPERVFFTSDAELTDDAYTGSNDAAANLYEYEPSHGGKSARLTDLTGAETDDTGEGAAVQGVVQISADGSYVYFIANGALTDTANARGERAKQGNCEPNGQGVSCNLYVYHQGEPEPIKFIATLAAGDASDWQASQGGGPANDTAVLGLSGSRLAFISERGLPTTNFPNGYDNEQAAEDECEQENTELNFKETGACRELYVYDAQAGTLACASCDPTGARPVGPSNLGPTPFFLSSYRPRNFSEGGTLFFDSSDALAPHAKDGRQNVYEFENGHVYPLSSIAGDYESTFLDAGANGNNVFFASSDRLLPEDTSQNVEVWDARVAGGYPAPAVAPSCNSGDSCKPPASPQPAIYGPPASATFSGPPNPPPPPPAVVTTKKKTAAELKAEKLAKALKACRKDKKKSKRTKCERQAKGKYGAAKKAKKSSNDRRTSR